jgi:NAD(P)-dependent dehydrogenase (short-subunit alcohol dehydrogenase family)
MAGASCNQVGGKMKDLSGKVAVVTGGAGGIGKALCEELVAEGAQVVVTDVQDQLLKDTAAELTDRGGEVLAVRSDVSDIDSMRALADSTWATFGGCHLLFNNAGVGAPAAKPWESPPNDWRWVFGVNMFGVANGVQAFVPRMIEDDQEGHVVNTSSPNGGLSHMPTAAVYAASKAAVSSFTETLQNQFLADGLKLRASVFYPSGGLLKTGMWEAEKLRPADLAREVPRTTPAMTVALLEEKAEQGGYQLPWQDLNQLARAVLDGIKDERFLIMLGADSVGPQLVARAEHLGQGDCPPHAANPML